MKHIRNIVLLFVAVVFFSCGKDYKDDIDKLNSTHTSIEQRVTSLETLVTKINSQLSQLSVLVSAVEQGFYITQVKTTATGYELTLNNGKVIVLQNGPDKILTPMPAVSITQISGLYYWTLNGVLLTDPDGKPISSTGITPVVRYDYTTMQWVISVDGGTTFQDVNVFASIVFNDTVLMQVINNYVRQHSTKAISKEVLFQIISTYIQKNYAQLFNIEILDEVVVNYVNKRYTRIFSYDLLEKIFNQYNFEYMTSQIKVEELVNVIVNFIREHKEIFIDNEVLYEIITTYIQMNKTTIFTNELLLEVINNFIENNENFIDVDVLTQVVNNYIDQHQDVIFNTEVVKNVIMEYVRRNYVKLFSQEILVQVLNTYVTKNSTTIFNRTLIEEVVNNYVQNNYTTIFKQETIVELINNYLKVNSTTILKREVLVDVITNYFEKNYNLFIDRTVITKVVNDYITKHQTTIISVDIVKQIINNYLEQYYVEIFTVDLLNEIIVNYFKNNMQVFTEVVNENIGIIQDVKVTDDYCTVTLKGGNKIKLVVFDAMARLRDRVQSIVALPNVNGFFNSDVWHMNLSLHYLVTPYSMANIIVEKCKNNEMTMELMVTDDNGNVTKQAISNYSVSNNQLYVSAWPQNLVGAVALHIKENKTGGTDIMTEFTPIEYEGQQPNTPNSYKTCPDNNHPHMIDLGLPSGTKWACCNVEASMPEDYGGYYAWGETQTKDSYNLNNYKYLRFNDGYLYMFQDIGIDIAGTQYDVAHVKWGDSWQMPTEEQLKELVNNTNSVWMTQNGVSGRKFTGSNGGSIFLPAAGVYFNNENISARTFGSYWSSSLLKANGTEDRSSVLYFYQQNAFVGGSDSGIRVYGNPIRPVANSKGTDSNDEFSYYVEDGMLIIKMAGIVDPYTGDYLTLYGTKSDKQNIWISIDGMPKGFSINNIVGTNSANPYQISYYIIRFANIASLFDGQPHTVKITINSSSPNGDILMEEVYTLKFPK